MIKIFYNNLTNRTVRLLLTVVFLSSFPTGASALALCLDNEGNHIVDHLYLADCHSSVEANLLLSGEHCSAFAEKENNNCIDISLMNANILNRPSKILLPASAKDILSYTLPSRRIGFQQQVTGVNSSALSQLLFTLPHSILLRTVVLLI